MAPNAYRSLRPSRFGWPRACSGLMYCTVPTVNPVAVLAPPASPPPGSSRRANAFASCRKRASIPGVQAISGWSTLHASRRSRSLSHSSYTSAKPPRPMSRFTSYFGPSARARRSSVVLTPCSLPSGEGGFTTARSFVITVGEAEPHAGQKAELVSGDGTKLVGWYLKAVEGGGGRSKAGHDDGASTAFHRPPPTSPALLWFYGNGETVAAIWPIVREFQPPGTALLVVDYPGYGGSGGRATEAALYAAAEAGYALLATRPGVDPHRIFVYGRSLGSAVAIYTAAHRPVAGLILESPFTSAAAMARSE